MVWVGEIMALAVILYAGRDPGLVQSRRLVLEQQGYGVDLCDNTEQFLGKFLDGDYDLVLLCNSLRTAEWQRLSSLVHRFSARTPVLRVCSMPEETREAEHACTGEPQTVLKTVADLLAVAGGKPPAHSTPPTAPLGARARP